MIRPITRDDREFIFQLVNTEGWIRNIGDRNIRDTKDAEAYIQKILDNGNYYYHVIELKETLQPIGLVTLLHRAHRQVPDIGFALLPEFERQGYAYEASAGYLDQVARTGSFSKIIGITVPDNQSSIRLLERLGLSYESNEIENGQSLSVYAITMSKNA